MGIMSRENVSLIGRSKRVSSNKKNRGSSRTLSKPDPGPVQPGPVIQQQQPDTGPNAALPTRAEDDKQQHISRPDGTIIFPDEDAKGIGRDARQYEQGCGKGHADPHYEVIKQCCCGAQKY